MGYEKPFTKLTFYKAFFSPQQKFLIHTILQCMSAKRTSWNKFSSFMALAVICLSTGRKFNFYKHIFDSLLRNVDSSTKFYMYPRLLQLMIRAHVGDLSSHTTKYSSPALTQKVFFNMRRVGKGFSGVETPLFEGMIVAQQADVVADEGAAGVDVNDVLAAVAEPSIPSPTPTTQPPPPSQELPSTLQGQEVKEEEQVESIRVKEIEKDVDEDVTLKDVATVEKTAEIEENDDELEPAELKELVEVVTSARLMTEVITAAAIITAATTSITAGIITDAPSAARRRKGVVIRYLEETPTPSIIIHSEPKSKDKGKGIMYFNCNVAFLEKTKEQLEEEKSRALKRTSESLAEKAAKKQKLDEEVEELKKYLQIVPNNNDDVYTKATHLALKMILLVERRYLLTRFTLDQMLNNVRLEVEEESEVSLELLRFIRQQQQDGFRPE
nr:hypothetical protein [Tanacetum cinerariifolium]